MTRYFIMRHGASESNLQGKVQGLKDIPLATLGHQQAKAAGIALRSLGITHIFTSPLLRTRQTAEGVNETLGLTLTPLDGLRARDLGEWTDMSRTKIKEMWNDTTHPFRADPTFAPPGGESLHVVEQRTFAAVDQVLQSPDIVPLFVMHLIGTGAVVHRTNGQRPPFKNTETWELIPSQNEAKCIHRPDDALLFGIE